MDRGAGRVVRGRDVGGRGVDEPSVGPCTIGGRAALIALALSACGAGAAVTTTAATAIVTSFLPAGAQTASLTLHLGPSGAQSVSGTLAGKPLTGKLSGFDAAIEKRLCPLNTNNEQTSFVYRGTFEGKPYSFDGCLAINAKLLAGSKTVGWFRVLGHFGTAVINGTATFKVPPKGTVPTFPFGGHVGSQKLQGTAEANFSSGVGGTITAHFTVG